MRENIMIGIWKIYMKMMIAITAVMIKKAMAGALIPTTRKNRDKEN